MYEDEISTEEKVEKKIIAICGHGRVISGYALNKLQESLKDYGITLVEAGTDVSIGNDITTVCLDDVKIKYEIPPMIEDPYLMWDSDNKYNWRNYKFDNSVVKVYNNINSYIKTKINKRNKFKNKRR